MSVNIDWMGHRYRVIHANFIDHWDWSDFHESLIKAHKLMSKSECRATLIFDFLGSIKASNKEFVQTESHPYSSQIMRFVIIADEPGIAKSLVQLLSNLYPHSEEIVCVSSYEEAFGLVQRNAELASV